MSLKEVIEIANRFFKVSTLIEDAFGYFDEGAFLIGDDSSSSRHIVNQRDLTK